MFGATQTNMRLAKLAPRRASLFANLETMQQKDTMVLDTWEKVLARDQAEFDADQLVHTEGIFGHPLHVLCSHIVAENSHIDVASLVEDKDSRVSELARMVIQLQGALKQSKVSFSPALSRPPSPTQNIRPDELMTFNSSDDTLSPRDSTTEDEEEDHMNVKRRRRATFSEGLYGDIKPSNSPFDLIVEGLCSKISKAKWTRDLQEFIYEHAYSILDFEQVFELMHQLRESKGEQSVLNMTSGEIRPCWAVV